jgi:hypothetical protein
MVPGVPRQYRRIIDGESILIGGFLASHDGLRART